MTPIRRHLTLALAAAALLGGSAAVYAQGVLDKINQTKTVKIAVPTDYPPYGFVGLDLKPQGLDVAMAELIAKQLGAKLEMVPVTSANRIPYLQTKQVDLVISTLGKNPEAYIVATGIYLLLSVGLRHALHWAGPRFIFGK